MRVIQKLLILVGALMLWSQATAGSYQGLVTNVTPFNGKVYVVVANGGFDGAASSCATGNGIVYSFDPATPFGRSLLAVSLSAKLSGVLAYAIGDAICNGGSPFPPTGIGEGLIGMDLKG